MSRAIASWSGLTNASRRFGIALLVSGALLTTAAALPSALADSLLGSAAPASAQAFQAGVDGDHAWMKVTNSEILSGAVGGACAYMASGFPYAYPVCPPISAAVRMAADNAGNNLSGASDRRRSPADRCRLRRFVAVCDGQPCARCPVQSPTERTTQCAPSR